MADSNTPFLLSYELSASASSRVHPISPTAVSPVSSAQQGIAMKSDAANSAAKPSDDSSYIGARKRLLEERVFGAGGTHISSSFPVDASGSRPSLLCILDCECIVTHPLRADIIKLVAASSSSPSAPTFGSVFHTPAGGVHVTALPPFIPSPGLLLTVKFVVCV